MGIGAASRGLSNQGRIYGKLIKFLMSGVLAQVLRCVASFAFSPADDMMNVERDTACVSASRRRRDRRLRSF